MFKILNLFLISLGIFLDEPIYSWEPFSRKILSVSTSVLRGNCSNNCWRMEGKNVRTIRVYGIKNNNARKSCFIKRKITQTVSWIVSLIICSTVSWTAEFATTWSRAAAAPSEGCSPVWSMASCRDWLNRLLTSPRGLESAFSFLLFLGWPLR